MLSKKVALYLRVSTNAQSTNAQLSELQQLVEQRGWRYEVFCDKGQSGAKESRPAFDEMMKQVRRGRFAAICIFALDRLARSLRQLLDISLELQRLNVDLVAVKQDLDTRSPSGRLVFGVLSTVAEFERDLLRERVRAGIAQARREGKRIGRPPLRTLTAPDIQRLRSERARTKASFRNLATKYKISVFTAFQLCRATTPRGRDAKSQ